MSDRGTRTAVSGLAARRASATATRRSRRRASATGSASSTRRWTSGRWGTISSAAIAAPVSRPPGLERATTSGRGADAGAAPRRGMAAARARRASSRPARRSADDRQRELRHLALAALAARRGGRGRRACVGPRSPPIDEVDAGRRAMAPAGERSARRSRPGLGAPSASGTTSPHAPPNRRSALRRPRRSRRAWWIRLLTVPSGRPERVGGLLERAALEVVQDHDRLVLGRQAGDALAHDLAQLGPLGGGVGPRAAVDRGARRRGP